jgi:predicted site-specific integrase-resolvase
MNGYMTVEEASKKWGVTARQVQIWCKEGRIEGATKLVRIWIVPETSKKPTANRRKPTV